MVRLLKLAKWLVVSVLAVVLVVAVAGMYKFIYLAGKDGYDADGNKIENTSIKKTDE